MAASTFACSLAETAAAAMAAAFSGLVHSSCGCVVASKLFAGQKYTGRAPVGASASDVCVLASDITWAGAGACPALHAGTQLSPGSKAAQFPTSSASPRGSSGAHAVGSGAGSAGWGAAQAVLSMLIEPAGSPSSV